jgi:hypothetical protein
LKADLAEKRARTARFRTCCSPDMQKWHVSGECAKYVRANGRQTHRFAKGFSHFGGTALLLLHP